MKVLVVMATWRVAGTQGRGLAMCLGPGIWMTSEHKPGWPRGSQGFPLLFHTHQNQAHNGNLTPSMAAPAPCASPGGPIILHLLPSPTPAP